LGVGVLALGGFVVADLKAGELDAAADGEALDRQVDSGRRRRLADGGDDDGQAGVAEEAAADADRADVLIGVYRAAAEEGAGVEARGAAHVADDLHRPHVARAEDLAAVVARSAQQRAADGEGRELALSGNEAGAIAAAVDVVADHHGPDVAADDEAAGERAA